MGESDFFASGQWNFTCALCGKKQKSGKGTKTWDGKWVCLSHKEVRNPQDFVRGVKDAQALPWTNPESTQVFLPICTLAGKSCIADIAIANCARANFPLLT